MYPQRWRTLAAMACAAILMSMAGTGAAADSPPMEDPVNVIGHRPSCPMGITEVWNGDAFGGCASLNGGFGFGRGSPGPGSSLTGGGGSPSVSNNKDPSSDPKKDRNDCNDKAEGHSVVLSHQVETLAITLFKLPGEAGLSYSLYYVSPRGWFDNLDYWLDINCGYVPFTGTAAGTNDVLPPIDPPFDPPDPPPCTHVTFHHPMVRPLYSTGRLGLLATIPVRAAVWQRS